MSKVLGDSPKDKALKLALVRDAIYGAAQGVASEGEFLLTFVNYAILLLQRPCCITFWAKDGQTWEFCFKSFRDDQYLGETSPLNAPPIGSEKDILAITAKPIQGRYGISVHRVEPTKDATNQGVGRLIPDPEMTKRCQELLEAPDSKDLEDLHTKAMELLLKALRSHDPEKAMGEHHPAEVQDDVKSVPWNDPFLNAARKRIGVALTRAFDPLKAIGQLNLKWKNSKGELRTCLNLFCAIRWISGKERRFGHFPYEAGVLLEEQQKKDITDLLRDYADDMPDVKQIAPNWDSAFELPVGPQGRTVFDSVVANGVIDFSLSGAIGEAGANRDHAGGPEDRVRQRVEKVVYHLLLNAKGKETPPPGQGRKHVIMSIPIRVAGTVWMMLYTFADQSFSGWYHCYALYRDTIGRTEETLRYALEGAFIDMVADQAEDTFGLPEAEFIPAVNAKWKSLGQMFPFEIPEMRTQQPLDEAKNSFLLYTPNHNELRVVLVPNRLFSREMVGRGCNLDRLERGLQARANQSRLRTETALSLLHTVKSALLNIRWPRSDSPSLQMELREAKQVVQKTMALANAVSDSLTFRRRAMDRLGVEELFAEMKEWAAIYWPGGNYEMRLAEGYTDTDKVQTSRRHAEGILLEIIRNARDHGVGEPIVTLECGPRFATLRVQNRFGPSDLNSLQHIKKWRDQGVVSGREDPLLGDKLESTGLVQILLLQKAIGLSSREWFRISHLDSDRNLVEFEAHIGLMEFLPA